jgi:hypothetical protein
VMLKEQRIKNKKPPRKRQPSRYCGQGHDKWETGASKRGRCNVCARLYQQKRMRPSFTYVEGRKLLCVRGHDRTRPNALGGDGRCRECEFERGQRRRKAA